MIIQFVQNIIVQHRVDRFVISDQCLERLSFASSVRSTADQFGAQFDFRVDVGLQESEFLSQCLLNFERCRQLTALRKSVRAVLVGCPQFCIIGKELLHVPVMLHALLQIMYINLFCCATIEGTVSKNLLQLIQHIINIFCISSFEEAFKLLKHSLIGIGCMDVPKELTCITDSATGCCL